MIRDFGIARTTRFDAVFGVRDSVSEGPAVALLAKLSCIEDFCPLAGFAIPANLSLVNKTSGIKGGKQGMGMNQQTNRRAWFCVRTHPKHEHIASANLKRVPGIEVFCPRLRTKKATRRGPVWMTDAVFPNYLFARFEIELFLDSVKYTAGVSHLVHFGNQYPIVPDMVMEELRANFGSEDLQVIDDTLEEGDRVVIADPTLFGMEAVVLRVLPAKGRVQVLIDMLGQVSAVELRAGYVVPSVQQAPTSMMRC